MAKNTFLGFQKAHLSCSYYHLLRVQMKQETVKVGASGKDIKVTTNLICSSDSPGKAETAILVEEY